MTPPKLTVAGNQAQAAGNASAVSVCLKVIRHRKDFLKAARAPRQHFPGFVLQTCKRQPDETTASVMRVGFTCSKKVGNAVARNRAKRRLREIARQVLPELGQPGWDYVLIGRAKATAELPFNSLLQDLNTALERIHQGEA